MAYPKYTWIGNRISEDQMEQLYQRKEATKMPITQLVAEAISEYLAKHSASVPAYTDTFAYIDTNSDSFPC